MSLTQAQTIFGGIHETGVNDLLTAFFRARPRYLRFGTSLFVPATSVMATNVPTVTFFGQTVHFQVLASPIPAVDIVPGSAASSALMPGVNEFTIRTNLTFSVSINNGPVISGPLQVFGLCEPFVAVSTPGTGQIGITLKRVEIVDITPGWLESVVEALVLGVLQTMLATMRLPFNTITAGAFGLILLAGPIAETDQIKVRGNAL
ncbi:MAG TPA: hypothetical protein VLL54_09220 [Pyrinomonadaceae bacterium]|nr:hypothetical protein [Pyrinomonadaceae bacterium]